MTVVIRMKKVGKRNRPYYRIGVCDSRCPRNGKVIETLGSYDPYIKDDLKKTVLKKDRIEYWMSLGARPSEKVATLL